MAVASRLTELTPTVRVTTSVLYRTTVWLLDLFGVNHLAGIEGAEERTVTLSDKSTVVCPAHGQVLKPDARRSCAFLAGDITTEPHR